MSVLVLGTVAFDAIETPFGKTDRVIGGAATYISLAAAQFTTPIYLVSVVGGDFPKEQLADFVRRGIHTEGLEVRPNEKSFFWAGRYHNDLNTRDTLATDLNVLADFRPQVPKEAQNADFVMLGNLLPSLQLSVLDQLARRPRLVVMDTMNYWLDTDLAGVHRVLERVDVLTVNDGEARQLAGEYSLVKAAKAIQKMGPKYVVIKKGEHGALLFGEGQIFAASALPLEDVFDPTGAGDTFAGGFLGYLAAHQELSFARMKTAVVVGSAMASYCVEKFGPERLLTLTQADISGRLQAFEALMQVDLSLAS